MTVHLHEAFLGYTGAARKICPTQEERTEDSKENARKGVEKNSRPRMLVCLVLAFLSSRVKFDYSYLLFYYIHDSKR